MARKVEMTSSDRNSSGFGDGSLGSHSGRPNIFLAAIFDDVALLERCLLEGENINQIDEVSGARPIHYAAYFGSTNFVRRVAREPGLETRVYDLDGNTPFNYAADREDNDIKTILFGLMTGEQITPGRH